MRLILSVKTLYRSPIKTILTFILLAVVTFAFFSQTAENAITSREFNTTAKHYYGVGSAKDASEERSPFSSFEIFADPRTDKIPQTGLKAAAVEREVSRYSPITDDQVKSIFALPYITSGDTRYMTAGVADTYFRPDDGDGFYNYTTRCVIEATFTRLILGPDVDTAFITTASNGAPFNQLVLENCKLLAGNPVLNDEGKPIRVQTAPEKLAELTAIGSSRNRLDSLYSDDYIWDTEYVQNMVPGERYIFVLRYIPPAQLQGLNIKDETLGYYLGDGLSNTWCPAVWPVSGEPANYLETKKFAPLKQLVDITNADMHTFDMVYTEDMSTIMRFAQGDMAIDEGRALTKSDSDASSPVCVVSHEFAKLNNLKIGDKISFKLGTELFEQYKGLGAVASVPERYSPAETPITLEIVGIYSDLDGSNTQAKSPNWTYSLSTVFLPKSFLPVSGTELAGYVFSPGEFSFKVENAWDISKFLKETAPKIEAMGLTLVFSDGGWTAIESGFKTAAQRAVIKFAVLASAVAVATGFVVYLFIGRKKKEYAIMRALGTPRNKSAWALILPLFTLVAAAVLVGSAAGWIYTVKTIAHNNTFAILKDYSVSTDVPIGVVLGCIFGEIAVTFVFALVLLRRIGKRSPLALLQGGGGRQARKNGSRLGKNYNVAAPDIENLGDEGNAGLLRRSAPRNDEGGAGRIKVSSLTDMRFVGDSDFKTSKSSNSNHTRLFAMRYIWRHIRRSTAKSTLVILLAALLFAAVAQFALMKQSSADLCARTVIKSNFVGGVALQDVQKISNSEFVKNPYYESSNTFSFNPQNALMLEADNITRIAFTNNIARYIAEEVDITYANGYDVSVMNQLGSNIIVGKALAARYGINLGDDIILTRSGEISTIIDEYVASYKINHPDEIISRDDIITKQQKVISGRIRQVSGKYKVVGVMSTASGKFEDEAFTPGANSSFEQTSRITLDVAEFILSDNMRSDEYRKYGENFAKHSSTGGIRFVMDTSKLENLKNSQRILEMLFPIVLAAALLIGGFLCCLLLLHSVKDAAIMRVLGTTKRKTRVILAFEQVLLCLVGLVVGACGLFLYKGVGLSAISQSLYLFAALYFTVVLVAAATCSIIATRRNVLELLQTKE